MDLIKKYIDENQFNTAFLISKIYQSEFENNTEFKKYFLEITSSIDNQLLSENDLKYINNITENEKYKKVLLLCNWCSSYDLCNLWNKMSKDKYTWNNIKIVWEEPCDYYCIINKPHDDAKFDPKKTILLRMEPNMEKDIKRWGEYWANPPKEDFLYTGFHKQYLNNVEWHITKNYTELSTVEIVKDDNLNNILSTVLSDKYNDEGHRKRIDFIKFLERMNFDVNVYGGNRFLWNNYKGQLPYHEKNNALLPYKYTFNCENQPVNNYFSEKLVDGILSECLTFYSGCPNIKNIIDERAYIYLELSNFEKDYEIVKSAIENDIWKDRLPYIKAEKNRILNELQFFPRIEKIINEDLAKK